MVLIVELCEVRGKSYLLSHHLFRKDDVKCFVRHRKVEIILFAEQANLS